VNGPADWEAANARFLSAAMSELRLRLELCAEAGEDADGWRDAKRHAVRGAAEATAAAERAAQPPPALTVLAKQLGLSTFERQVLLLCAGMELDTRIAALCAGAHGDPARRFPTFALAMVLFDDPEWAALAPDGPLRYWRLLEVNQSGVEPLTSNRLRADERIVSLVKGLDHIDERVEPFLAPMDLDDDQPLPASQATVAAEIAGRLLHADRLPLVHLDGADAASKRHVARTTARMLGLRLHLMPAALLPTSAAELIQLARLWQREAVLSPTALYLEVDVDGAQDGGVDRFLALTSGVVFLDAADHRPGAGRPMIAVDVGRPSAAEQRASWTAAVPAAGEGTAARLAGQFDLDLSTIRRVAREVRNGSCAGDDERSDDGLEDRLWDACLRETEPQPGPLARRISPKACWEQLVLPDDELELLSSLTGQVRQRARVYEDWGFASVMSRGFGITALFAGPSGTGKTMAAEVIARRLRLALYRIDLSAVVSKYIGETEKHLRRLFDQFEAGGAILLFDEADALFGKRTEVRDSHDRFANMEINYLLQRMESYRGLAILATNAKGALDAAFLRRLRVIVDFPFPDVSLRRRIWAGALPQRTPREEGLDLDRLARLNLSGGSIHNVALDAAFRAAEVGSKVTMPTLLAAARAEFRKLGLPYREDDFRCAVDEGAAVA
jgi:hypothetical protein